MSGLTKVGLAARADTPVSRRRSVAAAALGAAGRARLTTGPLFNPTTSDRGLNLLTNFARQAGVIGPHFIMGGFW